jgi:hypothetical protein
MAEHQRRYRVTGLDSEGDLHTFEADDQQRAASMLGVMHEDLEEAMLQDRGPRSKDGLSANFSD